MSESDIGFKAALEEAQKGSDEGGVPIGEKGSATLHAEISALENAGRLPASVYRDATMYTTLSPCDMCTGACVMYKVKRVVIGENKTFVGGEDYLKKKGIDVVVLESEKCKELMKKFITEKPGEWYEDIGEDEK